MSKRSINYICFMALLVVALAVPVYFAISAKQPAPQQVNKNEQVQQASPGLDPSYLPSDFVFVKDKGHHYFLYRDMSNFYLVWQDDTFARSVHIIWWLGPVR